MSIFDRVEFPQDLEKLNYDELCTLSEELRSRLIETVAVSGGHLASNLGVVELTLALHRVFSLPEDKIIWDVGHQSYIHKMLTGRKDKMGTIRQKGGLSGFPNPEESPYDTFLTGHSSTAISVALGLAKARDLRGGTEHIIAVVGDGALTGGLSFEALNQMAEKDTRLIIILNDNAMSISENVGGLSKYLTRMRTNKKYIHSKNKLADFLRKSEKGLRTLNKLSRFKDVFKALFTPGIMFEEWGLTYLGPIDGHDIRALEEILEKAKGMNEPIIIHVSTKKGLGYPYAQENPEKFHGISSFNVETGESPKKGEDFSSHFGSTLISLAKEDERIVAITPSMASGSGLLPFQKEFPHRFFDVGIAEGHSVTFGAGLSKGGLLPVCSLYSSFLQRAYDSVLHDCAIGNLHTVFAIDRAGAVPGDGKTHQGVFDIALLSHIPNMTVLSPASFSEQEKMLTYAMKEHDGPIAVRYPRGGEIAPLDAGDFSLGKAVLLREGNDVTFITEGIMTHHALRAAELLEKEGISAGVLYLRSIKPFDKEAVLNVAKTSRLLVTVENGVLTGGVGEHIAAFLSESGVHTPITLQGFPDEFLPHESLEEIWEDYGLTPGSLAQKAKEKLS